MHSLVIPEPSEGIRGTLEGNIAEERDDLGELSDGGLGSLFLPVDDGYLVNAQLVGDLVLK